MFARFFPMTFARKLTLLATVPMILAVAAIALLVAHQSREMAEREIADLEQQLIRAKREELKNYLALARASFNAEYGPAMPDDDAAKLKVSQILSAMTFGRDGYFFVFDYDGTNIVAPRRTELITRNWNGLTDSEGTPVVDTLIAQAQAGGGYHEFLWPKPSTNEEARMMTYVIGLQDWQWAVGTGVFLDNVLDGVAAARAQVEARVARTFLYIGAITLSVILFVFMSGLSFTIHERRLADAKLKKLTQRIFDTQEEERSRVARELHDGISQILVGVRYTLELARRRLATGDPRGNDSLHTGIESLNGAIAEVRRISRDLRPGVLDDLGLGPALKALTEEFETRTGIDTQLETVVFRNRLDNDSKIALYRIAQEALTNIERHSGANRVEMRLYGHKAGATLYVADNGCGLAAGHGKSAGLGLRNMQERMEQLNGWLDIASTGKGTEITATVPLTHILSAAAKDGTQNARDAAE